MKNAPASIGSGRVVIATNFGFKPDVKSKMLGNQGVKANAIGLGCMGVSTNSDPTQDRTAMGWAA